MAAKAEETLVVITGEASDPVGDLAEQRTEDEYFDKEKEEGSREAKRRRTCQLALEKFSSDEESGKSGRRGGDGLPFSFSFDTRSIAPIETTPKFGSFNSSADLVGVGTAAVEEEEEEEEEEKRSGTEEEGGVSVEAVEGKIGI